MAFAAAVFLLVSPPLPAQTVGTGNIVGRITDPQGKAIAGAKVEITNKATSAKVRVRTNSVGLYSSGPIQPGSYTLNVEAKGFNPAHFLLTVLVGNATRAA